MSARARSGLSPVERDDETVLAWAREPWACTAISLHVEHDPASVGRAADTFRVLIDVALGHGGSYSLTYHRWAAATSSRPRTRRSTTSCA